MLWRLLKGKGIVSARRRELSWGEAMIDAGPQVLSPTRPSEDAAKCFRRQGDLIRSAIR
jgi:hypothetical protein